MPAGGLLSSLTNPYCRVEEPYRTSATGLATYLVPKVGVQASLTWQSNPGPEIAANYVARCVDRVRPAAARPSLGAPTSR